MGAWGYGSFDNDNALDFIGDLLNKKVISKLIKTIKGSKLHPWNYDEVRVLAETLIHLHKINDLWLHKSDLDTIVIGLETIIADDDWFDTWDDESPRSKDEEPIEIFR